MPTRPQYEDFDATELFCPRCRRAQPVRKHLLLVLADGNRYDYRCAVCGASVGTKSDDDSTGFSVLNPLK